MTNKKLGVLLSANQLETLTNLGNVLISAKKFDTALRRIALVRLGVRTLNVFRDNPETFKQGSKKHQLYLDTTSIFMDELQSITGFKKCSFRFLPPEEGYADQPCVIIARTGM